MFGEYHPIDRIAQKQTGGMYQQLVRQRGWSLRLCERYLAVTWQRLLLASGGRARHGG